MKNSLLTRIVLLLCFMGGALVTKAAPDPNFHIYICWGQSNMEGNATVPDSEKTGVSDRFQLLYSADDCNQCSRKNGQWCTATPPLARCFHWNNGGFGPVDYFGRTLVEKLDPNIRVGVIVVACGGADIQLFEKDKYQSYLTSCADWLKGYANSYGGNPYGRIIDMAKIAQKEGVIKGILVHQGETNTGQSNWPSRLNGVYRNMLSDLGLNASEVPLLVGEVRYTGPCSGHNNVVRNVPNTIPTAHVISASGCEAANDEYHFTAGGYKLLGKRYAEKMLELLGDNPVQQSDLALSVAVTKEDEPGEVSISVQIENPAINKVEIYADNKVISTEETFTWSSVGKGSHSIWAVGYDGSNKEYSTSKTTINILEEQKPFNGTPFKIPGRVEAEEFDFGGEGNAYHDEDEENRNGGDRNEGVDMSNTAVGYTQKGEWLEYTVEVVEEGDYVVESRVASGADASAFTLYMDNKFIIPGADGTPGGFVNVPNTGDWETFRTVKTKLNKLAKGTHVLKLEITGDWVDIDYLDFKLASEADGEPDTPVTPTVEEKVTGKTGGTDYKVNNRRVYVYAPSNIKSNRPLVISLHGMNQDIDYQKKQAQWELVADTANFTVAYPQSDGTTWDISGMKDLNHIKDIINKMAEDYKVDLTRVYLSGFSMGGMTCYHAMNNMPDVFAAFAPVSGYLFGGTPNASTRPVPIFHTHGTSDDVVHFEPYQNQEGIEAVISKWKDHNKCTEKTTTTVNGATRTAYSGGDCEADVVLNAIPGKGHWHSNDAYHTTREIWKFISQYTTDCGKTKPTLVVKAVVNRDTEPGEVLFSFEILSDDVELKSLHIDGKTISLSSASESTTAGSLAAGVYTVWIDGVDRLTGNVSTSPKVTFKIFEPQTPYNGTPARIPGKIEAEEFDFGGEGNAYHDLDEQNRNGGDREEGVDMSNTAVGYVQKDEWIEYTVDVETSGIYEVEASMACESGGGAFSLYLDNVNIVPDGASITAPNTGSWDVFASVKKTLNKITKGTHILKLEVTSDWFDLDYLNFKLVKPEETGVDDLKAVACIPDGDYRVYDAMGRFICTAAIQNSYSRKLGAGFYLLRNSDGITYPLLVK